MGRLEGRVALVTGAAHERGIGRGIATALAQAGADVAINDVGYEDAGEQLAEELRALGRRAIFVRADVSDRAQVDALVERVEQELGPLWIAASNAGVADWEPWTEITQQSWDRIVGVNLTGAFNVGQAAARRMVAHGNGRAHRVHVVRARPDVLPAHGRVRVDQAGAARADRDDGDRARPSTPSPSTTSGPAG